MVGPILIIKLDDASADDAIAAGRWWAGGALGGRVRLRVVVRASVRQRGL